MHSPRSHYAPTSRGTGAIGIALITAIAGIALAIRLYRIDAESLWMDEVRQVSYYGLPLKYVVLEAAGQAQPPLDYLIGAGLHRLGLADSDWWVRFPAALFGAGGVLLLGLLVRRVGGDGAGVAAAALLAVCPLHVAMSQEARPYTIFFFFALATILAYLHARDAMTRRAWVVFGAMLLCMLMTRWVGPHIVVLCLAVHALWARLGLLLRSTDADRRAESSRFVATSISLLAAYTIYNPVFGLIYALDRGFAASREGQAWGLRVASMLREAFESVVGLGAMATVGNGLERAYIVLTCAIGLAGAVLLVRRCMRREGASRAAFAVVSLAFPFAYAAIYARFTWFPAKPQYLLLGAATYCTAAALAIHFVGIKLVRQRPVSVVVCFLSFCVSAVPMVATTLRDIRSIDKADWRGALTYLREHTDPEDAFVSLRPGGIRKGAGSDIIGADRYLQVDCAWLHVGAETKADSIRGSPWTHSDDTLWILCNAAPHGEVLLTPPEVSPGVRVHTFNRLFVLEVAPGRPANERLIDAIAIVDKHATRGGGLVAPNLLRAEFLAMSGDRAGAQNAIEAARRQCRTDEDAAAVAAFPVSTDRIATLNETEG